MTLRWNLGAIVFSAIWMAWALLLAWIAQSAVPLARAVPLLPGVPGIEYGWPIGWAIAIGILIMLLVALAFVTVGRLLARGARPSFAAGWLAAILAAAIVGAALDLPSVVRGIGMFGIRGLISEPYNLREAVVWAVFAGWIPALIVARRRRAEHVEPSAPAERRRIPLPALLVATSAVLIALVATGVGGIEAMNAQIDQTAEEQHAAEQEAFGALPDPQAEGRPVPLRADTTDPVPENACTPENAMLLIGGSDAATGHRGQQIQLMNFSDAPCTVEGYPDIAFADQNAHELDVTIEHGRSFMAEDPGPLLIEVPAQGTVTATIGWDANSTHGALVVHTVHAAMRAGEDRGSWPAMLDIVEGSTVTVTAWTAPATPVP